MNTEANELSDTDLEGFASGKGPQLRDATCAAACVACSYCQSNGLPDDAKVKVS